MLLTGSILAAFLMTGCGDDQDPAPPGSDDDGTMTEEDNGDMGGTGEMTPDDEMTPGDTEEGEGTPGEGNEGMMEDTEENMGEGTNEDMNGDGTDTGMDEENKDK